MKVGCIQFELCPVELCAMLVHIFVVLKRVKPFKLIRVYTRITLFKYKFISGIRIGGRVLGGRNLNFSFRLLRVFKYEKRQRLINI